MRKSRFYYILPLIFMPTVLIAAAAPATLQQAMEQGDLQRVTAILDADPSLLGRFGGPEEDTPLTFALRQKNLRLVQLILAKGADPNKANSLGTLPSYLAAESGDPRIFEAVLKAGAKFDPRSRAGGNIFHGAVASRNIAMVQYFIDVGMDPKNRDIVGNPAITAAMDHDIPMLEFLEKLGVDLGARGFQTANILHGATNSPSTLEWLLARKLDTEVKDEYGQTPLLYACSRGDFAGAKILLSAGAKLNVTDNHGASPLGQAITRRAQDLDFLKFLLDHGADPNLGKDTPEGPPLLRAVGLKNKAAVELLLSRKADVNAATNSGRSAVLIAVWNYPDILPTLVAAGADLDRYDDEGQTPLHWATAAKDLKLADQLRQLGAKDLPPGPLTNIHAAIRRGDKNAVEQIVAADRSALERKDFVTGYTPLHAAVAAGKVNLVEFLLQKGANSNVRVNGGTLLHTAAYENQAAMVKYLLGKGLDANAMDTIGRTPLHVAVIRPNEATIAALLAGGADPLAVTPEGATPLASAEALNPRSPVVTLLRQAVATRPSSQPSSRPRVN